MALRPLATKFFLILLLMGCVLGIYTAFTWIMGDLYGYKARYAVEQWQERPGLPELLEVDEALMDIELALSWEEDNPQYHELKARILYYKALSQNVTPETMVYIEAAKASHIRAIELRPRWPYSWANLVLMKSYLNEWDNEYGTALENAVKYGPWEQSVHLTLAHAAGLSWRHLETDQKRLMAANVERGIVRSFERVGFNLDAYQKRPLVCVYMKRDERQKKFCRTNVSQR